MDPWVWLAAYLVGFALLQVLLYRRFRRDVPQSETTTPSGGDSGVARAAAGSDGTDDATVACQHCGTSNAADATYRFCRECGEQIH